MQKIKKIYKRQYDNPIDENGNQKPNELLGDFLVLQQLSEDFYSEMFIGEMIDTQDKYLVEGVEVSFKDVGIRYSITKLNF